MRDDDDDAPMSAQERAERLARIKARIQAAIDDPRPAVGIDEAFARLERRLKSKKNPDDAAA